MRERGKKALDRAQKNSNLLKKLIWLFRKLLLNKYRAGSKFSGFPLSWE